MRFFLYLFAAILAFGNCSAQVANDEAVFKERLMNWVTVVNTLGQDEVSENSENMEKANNAFRDLQKFSREYPASKYADDAEFIRDIGTEVPVEQWGEFVAKYPDGKTEDLTRQELAKVTGRFSAVVYECYIPYELLPVYARGQKAWVEGDYKEAQRSLADFAQKIDLYYSDLRMVVLEKPYFILMQIYQAENKKSDFEKIKAKFLALFPNKSELVPDF